MSNERVQEKETESPKLYENTLSTVFNEYKGQQAGSELVRKESEKT